jgi:ArsR family transcriptional regulator
MHEIIQDPTKIAAVFKALSDPTRLKIFEFLCARSIPVVIDEKGNVRPIRGPTVGEVCCRVTGMDRITSRISFHLKELRHTGLITMERRGRNMICSVNREVVASLARYLDKQGKESEYDECVENVSDKDERRVNLRDVWKGDGSLTRQISERDQSCCGSSSICESPIAPNLYTLEET